MSMQDMELKGKKREKVRGVEGERGGEAVKEKAETVAEGREETKQPIPSLKVNEFRGVRAKVKVKEQFIPSLKGSRFQGNKGRNDYGGAANTLLKGE